MQWRFRRTLVAWIDSSNSPIHEEAREEFNVSLVAASILYRIFDETSTGIALLGRCSGTVNAIGNARHKAVWRGGEQRQGVCVAAWPIYDHVDVKTSDAHRGGLNLGKVPYPSCLLPLPLSNYRMLGRVFLLLATIGMFHGTSLTSSQLLKF